MFSDLSGLREICRNLCLVHYGARIAPPTVRQEAGMRGRAIVAYGVFLMLVGVANAADPSGTWLTQSGDSKVRIQPCGAEYCGSIVWLSREIKDTHNPDPALRQRSLLGLPIIFNMKASGETYAGKLYNPRNGKIYSGKLKLVGVDKLDLAGCVLGLFCKHETWTRAE
jgi:uncharacterized protein (DUF2147 family)